MGIPKDLLLEIDSFLLDTGMAESTFGRKVINDGKLVARLRSGKGITTNTLEKVRKFIISNSPNSQTNSETNDDILSRIADALDRIAPPKKEGQHTRRS